MFEQTKSLTCTILWGSRLQMKVENVSECAKKKNCVSLSVVSKQNVWPSNTTSILSNLHCVLYKGQILWLAENKQGHISQSISNQTHLNPVSFGKIASNNVNMLRGWEFHCVILVWVLLRVVGLTVENKQHTWGKPKGNVTFDKWRAGTLWTAGGVGKNLENNIENILEFLTEVEFCNVKSTRPVMGQFVAGHKCWSYFSLLSKRTSWQKETCCSRVWSIHFWFDSITPSRPQRSSTLSLTTSMGARYVKRTHSLTKLGFWWSFLILF